MEYIIEQKVALNYLKTEPEGLYFDRKSAKINDRDLANTVAAFANADGGIVVVGVNDAGEVEGFNKFGMQKLNKLQKSIQLYLSPSPAFKMETRKVKKYLGEDDYILLFFISPAKEYIVRNKKDEVFYRQGDSCIKLTHQQVRSLEYERKERDFETEIVLNSSIDDIDTSVLDSYKKRLGIPSMSDEQILVARGFLREHNGRLRLTNAGILLFGKNPSLYLPGARVRVVKFEGSEFDVGANLNIVKDKTFDTCLYRVIEDAKQFVDSQLREFTHLNDEGVFESIPEYPEFAWYEGLVNAVTHRDYSNNGEHTLISIYDDRLEIQSPGKLGGFVTIDTMKTKRYSRNPQIARALTEFGVVRELNEGVKRIYKEMRDLFLEEPEFSEPNGSSVKLVLYNNILIRGKRKTDKLRKIVCWNELSDLERKVVQAIYDSGGITSAEAMKIIGRSKPTTVSLLNRLIKRNLIIWSGTTKNDKSGKYLMR